MADHLCAVARPYWHGVGTYAMGSSDRAVVGVELRARGVKGLHVTDASVMPTIVSANTNATVLADAEKACGLLGVGRRAARLGAAGTTLRRAERHRS